jgi:hypothetical protein
MSSDDIGRLLAVAFSALRIARHHHHEMRLASSGV